MSTFEHQTHHINYHTYIQRTDIGNFLEDTSRSEQHPPNALCLSLLHHTTIGTPFSLQRVQNGHFFTTHVENQTVSCILVFSWETFTYFSFFADWISIFLDRMSTIGCSFVYWFVRSFVRSYPIQTWKKLGKIWRNYKKHEKCPYALWRHANGARRLRG